MRSATIFTAGESWINQLAGDVGRGRIIGIYAAALSAGFGTGPLILSLTGIEGWAPFLVNAAISALATLPLFGIGNVSRGFGRERGAGPLRMFARAPTILGAVAVFGVFESALMSLLPIWGVRSGLSERGGVASGIYPVALSMAGDRFRGGNLVSVNAAMIVAYGLGGLAGPPVGGAAMDCRNPQGLLWLFVALFAALLIGTRRWVSLRSTHPTSRRSTDR